MKERHGTRVEQFVRDGRPMLRVTDRLGYHVGYYRSIEALAHLVDVASLVDA